MGRSTKKAPKTTVPEAVAIRCCLRTRDWGISAEGLFFGAFFCCASFHFLAPFCFSAGKKEATLTWRERTRAQERKKERKNRKKRRVRGEKAGP